MVPNAKAFERSVREQIAINQARTPTERFLALCDLLDTVRAMAPMDPEAIARRRRALAAHERERERDREKLRAFFRRCLAKRRSALMKFLDDGATDVQCLAGAYGDRLDVDAIREELEAITEPGDPRRAKFETWVRQAAVTTPESS